MFTMRRCDNCLYRYIPAVLQPCADCGSCYEYDNWEPNEELIEMVYVERVYEIVKGECAGLDSIYEDYIIKLVGEYGLEALRQHNLIEGCGILNGRKLYVLCDKKED